MPLICIVEGDGDVEALPLLIRRIFLDEFDEYLNVPKPIRVHRDSFLGKSDERERYLTLARTKATAAGGILVLLDADEDCVHELCGKCRSSIDTIAVGLPSAMVVAQVEFESWFLGAIDTTKWAGGVLVPPEEPESVKNPKAWLKSQLPKGRTYSETVDQPSLASQFDWRASRQRCPSLDKLCRDLFGLRANGVA